MKIIAFYLPQFHNIPENDQWWGDGFTEWTNVKSAKPVYEGHVQPKIPLHQNYYNLLDDDVKIWQANLAKQYGIYGFCYYHYWFGGKLLLEKPMEQMLKNKKIDIPFCICWANEPWTKIWVGEKKVLYPQKYGDKKEWREHFDYMLPFFRDERYIKKNGYPFLFVYKPELITCLSEMISYWKECAVEAGLGGLCVAGKYADVNFAVTEQAASLDYVVEWQPNSIRTSKIRQNSKNPLKVMRRNIYKYFSDRFGIDAYEYSLYGLVKRLVKKTDRLCLESYDDAWKEILQMAPICDRSIPGAFVRWDNSPRFGKTATIIKGDTPEKFRNYLSQQIRHAREDYHEDMIFLFAWNEWAEGGYLEPDEESGYAYLDAVRDAVRDNDEVDK